MVEFANILVGVDLSAGDRLVGEGPTEACRQAVEQAVRLAAHQKSRVVLLAVLDVSPLAEHQLQRIASIRPQLLESAHQVLEPYLERARGCNVASDIIVACGTPWKQILARVQREQYDLVVLGAAQEQSLSDLWFGSTAQKLLRTCPCPVWMVPSQGFTASMSVLVATDFSATCDLALDVGGTMAALAPCPLHLLHAQAAEVAELTPSLESADGPEGENVRQKMAELVRPWKEAGVSTHIHLQHGKPEEVILQVVREQHVGLLALGTTARSGLSGFLVGNTAERILNKINCSLVVVKPPEFRPPLMTESH